MAKMHRTQHPPPAKPRSVVQALHRQWYADTAPTQFDVYYPLGEIDAQPTVPAPMPPASNDEAQQLAQQILAQHTQAGTPSSSARSPLGTIRRRHRRLMQGALEWGFLGFCAGLLTARLWGWV